MISQDARFPAPTLEKVKISKMLDARFTRNLEIQISIRLTGYPALPHAVSQIFPLRRGNFTLCSAPSQEAGYPPPSPPWLVSSTTTYLFGLSFCDFRRRNVDALPPKSLREERVLAWARRVAWMRQVAGFWIMGAKRGSHGRAGEGGTA